MPTRAEKKRWRRRVSRARWSRHTDRFVREPGRISIGSFMLDIEERAIPAPWER